MSVRRVLAGLGAGALVVACSVGETTYETQRSMVITTSGPRACESPFVAVDLGKLEACGDGKGHCYDGDKVAGTDFPACPSGGGKVCVPDKVLRANGKPLKACTFYANKKPGVCISLLSGGVAEHKDETKPDVCDPDERCIPCIHPLDGTDTHVCDPAGAHEAACTGGAAKKQESCCHGAGVCMMKDSVPEDARDDMTADRCSAGKVCAPAAMVSNKPVACDTMGASGVCLDLCFATQLRGVSGLMRSSCGPTEVCLPCAIGGPRGMPGC